MFKQTRYFGVLALFVNAVASAGSIAFIGFEGTSGVGNPVVSSYQEREYIFSSSSMQIVGSPTLCQFGGCAANSVHTPRFEDQSFGQYLAQNSGASITLALPPTASDPTRLFNLRAFNIAEMFLDDAAAVSGGFRNATTVTITGTRYDTELDADLRINSRTVTASFMLDGIKDGTGGLDDFQSVAPPVFHRTDPRYSEFFAGEMFRNVSSVTFSADGAFALDNIKITTTPEPATWALFLLGLTSLVYFRRRSSRVSKAVH